MPQTEFSKKLIAAYEAEVKNSGKGSTSGTNITERTNARAMQNDASFVQQYAQGRQNYIDQQERKGWVQTRMRQKRTDSKAPEIVAYNAAKAAEATQAAIERYNNALTSYSTKVNDATQKARSYGTTAGEIGAGATGALHSVMGDAGRTTQSSQTRRDVAGGAGVLPGRILTDGSKKSGITDAGTVSKTKSKSKSDAKLLTSREHVTDIAKTIQDQRDSSKVAKPITADTVAPASKTNLFSQAKYQVARTAMESAQQRVNEAQTVEDFNKAVSDFTRAAEAVGTMEAEQIVSSGAAVRQEEFVKKNASPAQGEQLRREYQALELLLSPSAQAVTGNASALWASAAMSEKERKDASARLSQLGRLIQLNDQYSSPTFKVSQLAPATLRQKYQNYSSLEGRKDALLDEAADYRRSADRLLSQGNTKQYHEAIAQAQALERQADAIQVQMDSITGGDEEYADALVRQGSAAELVSDAASDKNFAKYVQAGKNKGFSPELREWLANADTASAQKYGYTTVEAQKYIDQMTDEQRDTFYYYVGKGDTEKAQEFFSALEPQLEQAVSAAQQMGFAQFTQEHPVAGTAINAASQATIAPILGVMSTAQNAFNSDMRATPMTGGIVYAASDANQGATLGLTQALMYGTDLSSGALTGLSAEAMFYGTAETAKKHGMTEEQLAEAIQNEDHGEARMSEETASFLAGNIISMANNLAQMGVGMAMGNLTGAAAGAGTTESINATQQIIANIAKDYPLAIMGTTAATEQVRSALESGQDLGKALAYGALVGAVEVWTENIGIDEFISGTTGNIGETLLGRIVQRAGGDLAGGVASVNNAALRAAIIGGLNISGNALSEGMEEVISNLVDVTADVIINGEDSELAQIRNQLMEQGVDVSEATNQAWLQLYIRDTAESFVGGALSGALFGIGGGAIAGVSDSYNRNAAATRAAEQMLLHGTADDFIQGALDISDRSSRAYQLAEQLAAKNDRGVSRTVEADGRVVVDSTDETSLTNVRDLKNLVLAVEDYAAEQARQDQKAARLRAKETARANKSGGKTSADSGALSVAAQRYMDTGVLKGSQARAIGVVLDKIATGQNVTDTEIHTLNAKVPAIREQLSLDLGFELQSGSLEEVRAAINHYQENNRAAAKEADGMKAMNDAARAVRPYVRQEEIAENRAEVADAMEATRAEADTELAVEAAEEDALAGEQAAGTVQEIDRNVRARQEQETAQRAAREERDAIEALRDEDGKISYKAFADYYKKAHADAGPSEIQRAYENVNQDLRSGTVTIDDQTYTWSELKKEMQLRDMDHSDAAVDRVFLEARSRATEDGGAVRMSMTEAEAAAQNKKPAGKYSESNPNRLVEWTAARFAKVFRDDGVKIEVDYDWKGPARSNAYHRVNTDGTRVIVLNGNMSSAGIFNQTIYRNQRMITLVCAHELGHDQWIKIFNAEGVQTGRTNQSFMDEVLATYREVFNISEEEVQAELDRHRDTYSSQINPGEDIDDYVREEYAADCLGELMVHTGGLQRAIEMMDSSDPGIFRRTLNRIKAFADGITGKNKQATEMRKAADDLLKRFQKARDNAAEYRARHGATEQGDRDSFISDEERAAAESAGIEVDAETQSASPEIHYSRSTWNKSEYVQNRDQAAQALADSLDVPLDQAKAWIDDINSIAKIIAEDQLRLDYEASPGRSSFVSNAEYGGSIDFSTICKKRRLLTGTIEAIQAAMPDTVLTSNDFLAIRDIMKANNSEVNCGLCYVEGSRAKMGEFAAKFVELYKQHFPDAEWFPNQYDVATPTGSEQMRLNHPEAYKWYEYFWNHYGTLKKGDPNLFASQQKPKLYQQATEYNGEILDKFKKDATVEQKNENGGLRLQSFSDFEIIHLIDSMQVIMDMANVGLAGQAYTKVPDFAWALGDTGLKINLSLIAKGVDENGRLILDEVEGMKVADAMALRNHYSDNVGTIVVTFDLPQLMAAMADDRIDFIIPFHKSQWNKSQFDRIGLPKGTKDFTRYQNEKLIKQTYHLWRGKMVRDKASNYMPNTYWDFNKTGKENAETYLRMCAENNKRPKFYQLLVNNHDGSYSLQPDGSTDGYWKLLIDFKMYNNEGVGVPQRPVTPNFNMDEAMRMLDEYTGGHETFPVDQAAVDEFVKQKQGGTSVAAQAERQLGDNRYSISYDAEYMQALSDGDDNKATQLVRDVAAQAGFSVEGYHGTLEFGFTKIDTGESDDNLSFFVTSDVKTAETYSTRDDIREIREGGLSAEELEAREDKAREAASDAAISLGTVINSIAGIQSFYNINVLENEFIWAAEEYRNDPDEAGLDEYLSEKLSDLEWELYQAVAEDDDAYDGIDDWLERSSDAARFYEAWNEAEAVCKTYARALATDTTAGNYHVFINPSNLLEINGNGANWNSLSIPMPEDLQTMSDRIDALEAEGAQDRSSDGFKEWVELNKAYADAITSFKAQYGYEPGQRATTRELARYASRAGYDGVVFRDIIDHGGRTGRSIKPADVYALFKPQQQVKSADMVTLNDAGEIIPLSERFNPQNDDIRYSFSDIDWNADDDTLSRQLDDWISDMLDSDISLVDLNRALGILDDRQLQRLDEAMEDEQITEPEKRFYIPADQAYRELGIKRDGDRAKLTPERISDYYDRWASSSQNYSKAYMTYISPENFLSLTTANPERIAEQSRELNQDELRETGPIYLVYDADEGGKIIGHEGRHRMMAMKWAGIQSVPVAVEFQGDGDAKSNRQPIDSLRVTGQTFWNGEREATAPGAVELQDLVPINQAHRSEVEQKFGADDSYQGVRFSVSQPVEDNGRLIAAHNLTEKNLLDALKLGGLPMPSIAIVDSEAGHTHFGPITLLFGPDTIDPQADRRNRVYGGDAWTPTAPSVDYEVNTDEAYRFDQQIYEWSKTVAGGIFANSSVFRSRVSDDTSSNDARNIAERLATDSAVKAAYLAEHGMNVEPVRVQKEFDQYGNDFLQTILDTMGAQDVAGAMAELEQGGRLTDSQRDALREIYRQHWIDTLPQRIKERRGPELVEKKSHDHANELSDFKMENWIRHAWEYYEDGGSTKTEIDKLATANQMNSMVTFNEVADWVEQQLQGVLGERGIYNGKDPYTASGNRRTFRQLHWDYTLDNIVRAMATGQDARGQGLWGATATGLQAVASPEYRNLDEIRADSGRLGRVDSEEYVAQVDAIEQRISDMVGEFLDQNPVYGGRENFEAVDAAGTVFVELAKDRPKDVYDVIDFFNERNDNVSLKTAREILSLIQDAASLPTEYFEAKPQRAVGFDEVVAAIIPMSSSQELRDALKSNNIEAWTYDETAFNESDRKAVTNSVAGFHDVRFSISDADYMDAVNSGDMDKAREMVQAAAEAAGFQNAIPEQTLAYKTRTGAPPQKTIKVYKVFTVAEDGSPTALFVSGVDKLPQNVWLDAQDTWHFTANNGRQYVPSTKNPNTDGGKTGGQVAIPNDEVRRELYDRGFIKSMKAKSVTALAYRPGWHAGDLPFFPQGGMQIEGSNYANVHRYNQVVFECELAADTDYTTYHIQDKGENAGKVVFHDRQEMPTDGYYKFATNPMANANDIGSWYISGSLKIIRALTEAECNQILQENGRPIQEWQQYQDKAAKRRMSDGQKYEYEHTFGDLNLERLGYNGEQYDAARKTLAPVTYDDNGNVIPLSQRFNAKNPDIRYSFSEYQNDDGTENTLDDGTRLLSKRDSEALAKALRRDFGSRLDTEYLATKLRQTMDAGSKLAEYLAALTENGIGEAYGTDYGPEGLQAYMDLGEKVKAMAAEIADEMIADARQVRSVDYDPDLDEMFRTQLQSKLYIPDDQKNNFAEALGYESYGAMRSGTYGSIGRFLTTDASSRASDVSSTYEAIQEAWPGAVTPDIVAPEDQLAEIYRRYQQVLSLKNDKVNSLDNSETPREWSEQDITNRIMEELMNRAEAESKRIKEQYHIARQAEAARLQREAARAQKQAERAEAKGAENVQELQTQAAELNEQADEAKLMAQTDEETILEAVHDAGLGGEAAEQRMQEQRAAAAEKAATPSVTAPVQSEWDKIMASVMEKNGVIKPVSKVRSNTFQNSGMFEQAELEMLNPSDYTYTPSTEKGNMERAAKRLDEDYLKWYRELPEKAAWEDVDLDTAMRILEQVRDEARNTGDYSEVVRWAKIIQERGTQGGQFLQAFNKYTRTPEAVLAKAVQQLEDKHLGSKINGKAILDLSDQNDALQLALDMQEKQNADLANQYADLMKELEALKAELSDAKQQGRDLKKGNKKLNDQISRMGVRIIKQAQEIYKLDAENLRLLDVQETAREELQKQFDKLSKLGRENTKVVQENSRLDRQIKRAEKRYEALQAQHVEILAARDLINDFLRRGDLTVEEVEALGDRLRDLNARLKGYNDERTQSIKAMRDLFVKLNRTTDASEIQKAATSTDDADLNEDNKVLIQNLLDSLSDDKKVALINDMAEYADVLSAAQEGDKETLVDLILRQARTRGFNPGRGTRENLMKQDWSYLNQFALTQLANIADDYEKRGVMEKISSWQYIAQLMNLRTSLRNVTSNAAFYGIDTVARNSGALLDAFIGHFTGNRTVAFSKFGGNESSAMQGARERAGRAALEVALDVDLGNAKSKYGEGSRRTFKMAQRGIAGALSRTMSRLEMVNGMSLNVTDEFFKGAIYQGTINSYAAMVDKGLITQEEAEQFAEQDMLYRTFQDETALGTILNGLHDLLNLNNPRTGKAFGGGEAHKFGLGDIIVKYRGVPGALVHRALEFSPGGYVKALYNVGKLMKSGGTDTQAQRNAVLGISRATTGSGLIALFAILAKLGLMKRDDDEEDKNVAALNRAEGLGSTQVNLDAIGRWIASGFQDGTDWREGDDLMDIGFMDPLSSAMTMGSLLFKNLSEGEGLLGALTAANGGMMAAAFSDLSMMNTINDAIYAGLYHDENSDLGVVGDVAITMASSGITGMIPSLLRQIAQAADLNYRDAYGGGALEDAVGGDTGAALQQALNNIMTTIPGLRQMVPTKIDPLGNEKVYAEGPGAWLQNAMNSLFNPGKVNKYTRGDVSSELAKIRTATGDSSFYPDRNGDKTVTIGDEKIRLNDEQRRQYLLDAGDTYEELALETINSEAYQSATAAEKAEMLKSVKSYSEYKARQNLYEEVHGGESGYQPYQNDDWRKTEAGMSLGLTFSDMQTILRDTSESRMTPLYDENGDSIQGSYEQKLLDYLNGLDYSDQDKLQLYSIIRGNNGDSTFRKIQDTMDAGLSFFEAADVRKKYLSVEYQNENNTNLQEVDYFLDWLKDEGYNATEIDRIMENYQFRNSIQQDPSSLITRMTGNGVDQDTAFDLANDLAGLKPEEGRSQVSNQQKFDVIVGDYNLDVSDKQMAIAAVGGDTSLFSSLNESAASDLMNLYQATGDTGVLSMAPGQYCTIDSVRYDYDDAQIDAYSQAYIGIMNGTDFSGVTSSKVADGVKDIAANAGKFAAWQQAGWTADLDDSTFSTYRKAQQAQNVGLGMADYCEIKQACNDFTADKDANGNSISGSKKTKVVSYLQSLGLTSAQYNFFYSDIMGYK